MLTCQFYPVWDSSNTKGNWQKTNWWVFLCVSFCDLYHLPTGWVLHRGSGVDGWMGIKKTLNYKLKKAPLCFTKADCHNTWRHLHLPSCSCWTDSKHQFLGLPCARNLLTWQTNKQTNNTYLHLKTQTVRLSCVIDLANDGAETEDWEFRYWQLSMDEHHWCFKWQGLLLAGAILLLPGWFSKIIS